MTEDQAPDLYECMTRLRWQASLLALLLVLLNQIMEQTWLAQLPRWQHSTTQVLYYGLIGPSFA